MSSFDYELKDHLRRAGAPVLSDYERRYRAFEGAVYNTPPDVAFDVETLIEDAKALVRRSMRPAIYAAATFSFASGILATLAVQHIFGAA